MCCWRAPPVLDWRSAQGMGDPQIDALLFRPPVPRTRHQQAPDFADDKTRFSRKIVKANADGQGHGRLLETRSVAIDMRVRCLRAMKSALRV